MIAFLAVALGASPTESNVSVTTLGTQFWQSAAVGKQDLDLLVEQRLRWTLVQNEGLAVRLRADGRFTLDTDGTDALAPVQPVFFERNRVRQLGVSFIKDGFTLELGRSRVHKGGPRLVDGIQLVAHPSPTFDIGAWAGLAPDTFTTEFRTNRFGLGPIVAYSASRVQASFVGDFLIGGGGLDRAAVLLQARVSAARTIEVAGRLDMDLASNYGPHLQDGQLFVRWAPVDSARIDVFYDAFSSYLYKNTENLDPDISRFGIRMRDQDLRLDAVLQDCLEPKVAHAVGTNFALQPRTDGVAPLLALKGRYRFGGKEDLGLFGEADPKCGFDDINTFLRVNPTVGLTQLPVGGRLDLKLDGNFFTIDGNTQYDAGVILFWEPSDDGLFAFDTSYRLLINPYDAQKNPLGYDGPGHYADVFVDLVVDPADLMLGLGLNIESEPGVIVNDLGVGAYARVTKYLRSRK